MPDDLRQARKPRRASRTWLVVPWVLAVLAFGAWSGWWLYARYQMEEGFDRTAEALRGQGYQMSWQDRRIHGYPFRFDLDLTGVRLGDPSGWAIAAPTLKAEAWSYDIGHWIVAAPDSLVLTRPGRGDIAVRGDILRASFAGFDRNPPRISVEGVKLSFAPVNGGEPLAVTAADRAEIHIRPHDGDMADINFHMEGGQARFGGLIGRVAEGQPVTAGLDAQVTKASAFRGRTWADMVRAWSAAGGVMTIRQGGVAAGKAELSAEQSTLKVAPDGVLDGTLLVDLKQASGAFLAMGAAGTGMDPLAAEAASAVAKAEEGSGQEIKGRLSFKGGRTTLGPLDLGPAPRAY